MQNREVTASLTRKSKKDDVEALLSDFDILDDNGKSISMPAQATTSVTGAGAPAAGSMDDKRGSADVHRVGQPETSAPSVGSRAHTGSSATKLGQQDEASSLLADLDDLVKQRRSATPKQRLSQPMTPKTVAYTSSPRSSAITGSRSGTPGSQTPREQSIAESAAPSAARQDGVYDTAQRTNAEQAAAAPSWDGWWSSATKLADQARAELEKRASQVQAQVTERAKEAGAVASSASQQASVSRDFNAEGSGAEGASGHAKPWMLASNVNTFLKSHAGDLDKLRSDLGKVGLRGWNEIIQVVAPPIEKHEVLSITLSHDMTGFDGLPDVVFQVLQRVMESHASTQDAEHQLVVNSAPTATAADENTVQEEANVETASAAPDMHAIGGFQEGWRLAETKLDEFIKDQEDSLHKDGNLTSDTRGQSGLGDATLPIIKCPLFIRLQAISAPLPGVMTSAPNNETSDSHVFIAILLRDTANKLTHRTISQPIPRSYVSLPFEEEPWAEDLLSESLQAALSSVGIEYIRSRMQARKEALVKAADAVQTT